MGGTWFDPYAGYLHLLPRLSADLVTALAPLPRYAVAVTAVSCLVVAIVAVVVYVCAGDVIGDRTSRVVVALVPTLLPITSWEVLGNLANLHWFLLWVTPWLLLRRYRTRTGLVLATVGAAVIALTEIQAVLFVPLMLWHARDARRWPPRIALVVGLGAQVVATIRSPRAEVAGTAGNLSDLVTGYLVNVIGGVWWADAHQVGEIVASHWPLLVAAALPFVGATAYVLVRGDSLHRVATAAFALGSLGAYGGAYLTNGYHRALYSTYTPDAWLDGFQYTRYGVVPGMLLVALLPLALSLARSRSARVPSLLITVGLLLLLVAQVAQLGSVQGARAAGPVWPPQATTVVDECDAGAAVGDASIAPGGPWLIVLPCSFVEGGE